jgi:hypothetical protein
MSGLPVVAVESSVQNLQRKSGCFFDEEACKKEFVQAIGTNGGVIWDLKSRRATAKDAVWIGALLSNTELSGHKRIKRLMLDYNAIGDQGVQALSDCLKVNAIITELSLPGARMTDVGVAALAQSTCSTSVDGQDACCNDATYTHTLGFMLKSVLLLPLSLDSASRQHDIEDFGRGWFPTSRLH